MIQIQNSSTEVDHRPPDQQKVLFVCACANRAYRSIQWSAKFFRRLAVLGSRSGYLLQLSQVPRTCNTLPNTWLWPPRWLRAPSLAVLVPPPWPDAISQQAADKFWGARRNLARSRQRLAKDGGPIGQSLRAGAFLESKRGKF